jgi:hypothetical protein
MAFPSTLTGYTQTTATSRLNNPSHSGLHNTVSSALGQVEAVIGVDGQNSILGTIIGDLRSPGSGGGGHIQTANKGGTGQISYTKGDILVAQSSSVLGKQSIGADGNILIADSTQALGIRWGGGKFGGTGADGALSISSGTTTINVASVQTFIKNYSSISITGTGRLTFSSPNQNGTVVVLKSQGNTVITSSASSVISLVGMGAQNGNPGYSYSPFKTFQGGPATVNGGGGGSVAALGFSTMNTSILEAKYANVVPGGGGNNSGSTGGGGGGGSLTNPGNTGSTGQNAGSTGGGGGAFGGGGLIMEIGGTLNFTSSNIGITVAGQMGNPGTGGGPAGGGGGGGAGIALIIASSIIANSGTIDTSGGTGGVAAGAGGAGGAGGSGYSLVTQNTEFL